MAFGGGMFRSSLELSNNCSGVILLAIRSWQVCDWQVHPEVCWAHPVYTPKKSKKGEKGSTHFTQTQLDAENLAHPRGNRGVRPLLSIVVAAAAVASLWSRLLFFRCCSGVSGSWSSCNGMTTRVPLSQDELSVNNYPEQTNVLKCPVVFLFSLK